MNTLRVVTAAAAVVAVLSVGACTAEQPASAPKPGGQAGTHPDSASPTAQSATSPSPSKTPKPPPPLPDPKAKYSSDCDYELGNFTSGGPNGMRFTADADLHNTGNIGVVVKVTGAWFLSGGQKVTHAKTVRVTAGRSLRTGFWVPATQDQISSYQSVDEASGFDGSACKVTAKIIDTFGSVH